MSVQAAVPTSADKRPTRERLVAEARKLFLTKGYEATGMAEILQHANVNSGSLYHFFKNKEELLLAVLDQYIEQLHATVMDPVFARVPDPIARIFAVMDAYRQMLSMTDCRQGCPIGNLALEMSEKSEPVREKIAAGFDGWRSAIRACLDQASDRLPRETNRDMLATFILAVMEGGVMQARAYRSMSPFDAGIKILRDYVDRLLAAAPSLSIQPPPPSTFAPTPAIEISTPAPIHKKKVRRDDMGED